MSHYKPVNNDAKGTLLNLALVIIDEHKEKIGESFRVFRKATRNLSRSQLKGLFATALVAHRYAEQQAARIRREREEFLALLEKARNAYARSH